MKTFKNFILEAEDSKRKSFDNLPGEFQQKPKPQVVSPVERLQSAINQLKPQPKNYIRQDLERRRPNPSNMPGSPPIGSDPTNVKVKSNMPVIRGRYTPPKYYDI
jgi:hypothetical protein